MALRDVLAYGDKLADKTPVTSELIANVGKILAAGDVAAGVYDVDEVLKLIVIAMHGLEASIAAGRMTDGHDNLIRDKRINVALTEIEKIRVQLPAE